MRTVTSLTGPVLVCLFAALISVGAYIALPLPGTPVPIVMQNFFIMLCALLVGPFWGLGAVLVYLFLGALGLPVFAGGTGGFARIAGPTGGYLIGYIPSVLVMGLVSRAGPRRRWWRDGLALAAGIFIVYACGVPWLKLALGGSWRKAFVVGALPFILGDVLKATLALLVAGRLGALVERALARHPWKRKITCEAAPDTRSPARENRAGEHHG